MRRLKFLHFIWFPFYFLVTASGQGTQGTSLVHFDKAFYVSGEHIWYHVFLPSSFESRNVAVRMTLHDESGMEIHHQYHRADGIYGFSGYYQIPFDQPAGVYPVAFSVYLPQNKETRILGVFDIPIYNDLQETPPLEAQDITESKALASELILSITVESDAVKLRDKVRTQITVVDENGSPVESVVSISVIDSELLVARNPQIQSGDEISIHSLEQIDSSIFYTGLLADRDEEPLQANVLGAYVGRDQRIYYTKSDAGGRFVLKLPDFHGSKAVQFLGYYKETTDIKASLDLIKVRPPQTKLRYTQDVLDYIELSRLRKKIYQLYTSLETQIVSPEIRHQPQALNPDLTYRIKEYENFDDIRAFFGELVTPLTFRVSSDSVYNAVLYNTKAKGVRNTFLTGTPLFIVDDKVTHDANFVARMSLDAVETVELFVDPDKLRRTFQAIGMSGVVRVTTQLQDVPMPESSEEDLYLVTGLQAAASFPGADLTAEEQPIYRPLIYWSGGRKTDSQGKLDLEFFHTDDPGKFIIQVVAQGVEGFRGYGTASYNVEQENP